MNTCILNQVDPLLGAHYNKETLKSTNQQKSGKTNVLPLSEAPPNTFTID